VKYLVIQTRDIGDVMLSTALCTALKASHPKARVDMLTMSHCAGIVEGNPDIDEIVILDNDKRNEIAYMWGFLRTLRAAKYDVLINVQGQLIGLFSCLFSMRARRIGFKKFPWSLVHSENVRLRHNIIDSGYGQTIDDRFALLEPLGLNPAKRAYTIHLSEAEQQAGRSLLREAGLDLNKPIVALGINSRDDYKQWPLQHFADNAAWLNEQYGAQIYVPYGPGEEEYSKGLRSLIPETQRAMVFDNVRTRNIRELAAVFSQCALYLGNDTGPRHIAQALDVPALAVVSPASDKWAWIPWDNPRFRAVDSSDALGISKGEWSTIRESLTWGIDDAEWFEQLNPGYVRGVLGEMIAELGLFAPATPPAV
jgi:heptosyltransferase-3